MPQTFLAEWSEFPEDFPQSYSGQRQIFTIKLQLIRCVLPDIEEPCAQSVHGLGGT